MAHMGCIGVDRGLGLRDFGVGFRVRMVCCYYLEARGT